MLKHLSGVGMTWHVQTPKCYSAMLLQCLHMAQRTTRGEREDQHVLIYLWSGSRDSVFPLQQAKWHIFVPSLSDIEGMKLRHASSVVAAQLRYVSTFAFSSHPHVLKPYNLSRHCLITALFPRVNDALPNASSLWTPASPINCSAGANNDKHMFGFS